MNLSLLLQRLHHVIDFTGGGEDEREHGDVRILIADPGDLVIVAETDESFECLFGIVYSGGVEVGRGGEGGLSMGLHGE